MPSFTAFAVVGLLERYFGDLVDYGFTAIMEDDLDEIASGREEALPWLTRFYFGTRRRRPRCAGNGDAGGEDGRGTAARAQGQRWRAHLGDIDAREINSIPHRRRDATASRSWPASAATGPTSSAARTGPPSPTTWLPTS